MEFIIKLVSEVILFLVGYYFIFAKKYFEELGKQTAELSLIAKKTMEIERTKEEFNQRLELFKKELQIDLAKEIEPFKASLSRSNINYQIYKSEFAKLRFQRFDQLYAKLYDLQFYTKSNLFNYSTEEEYAKLRDEFKLRYRQAEDAYYLCLIYLDDDLAGSSLELLNQCFSAFQAHISAYYSDQNRKIFRLMTVSESLLEKNIAATDKFFEIINKFPQLLHKIRDQVHQEIK